MKTLYERLDKKVLEAIVTDMENYPISTSELISNLKSLTSVNDLRLEDAINIKLYAKNLTYIYEIYPLFK